MAAMGVSTLWALCGFSQDRAAMELPMIEVSGTRLAEAAHDQPYALYQVDKAELDSRVGRTVLDRVNYGPGVFIQRTAPNQASPFIRGLTGEQTLLTLDGVRLSHALMRPGPNQYAALVPGVSVDRVDAILGSSSVVNGSDGLTGALDFRLAPAGRGVAKSVSPWSYGKIDSGNGWSLQTGVDGDDGDFAYSFELSHSDYKDREGGKDFRDHLFGAAKEGYDAIPNTAYDESAGGLRLAYYGLDDHTLEVKAGHSRQNDAPRPGGYFENSGKSSRVYRFFDPQEFSFVHARDQWALEGAWVNELQTTMWWHQFAEKQYRSSIRNGGTLDEQLRQREYHDRLNAYGIDLQARTDLSGKHDLTWGGTFVYEHTDNAYREFRSPKGDPDPVAVTPYQPENWSNNTSVSDDSEYTTFGLYIQDDWQCTPDWSLLSGLRYSLHTWDFGSVHGDADDLTWGLRSLYEVNEQHRFFAGLSKAFRAPNLNNLDGAVDRGSSGEAAQGNPDLDPEVSYSLEAGWSWLAKRNRATVTGFHTRIDDLIQRDFGGSGAFTNIEDAELQGIELDWDVGSDWLSGRPDDIRLSLVGSASLVDATRDIPQEDGSVRRDNISRANRLYGRVGLRVDGMASWWGLLQMRWHDDYDEVARDPSDADADDVRLTVAGNPDGSLPGYEVIDAHIGWRSPDENTEVTFFVENILDETYREPGSGVDGVGRNFGVSGGLRF